MATDVLNANEVRFTISSTTYRYPILGGVRPSMISPFAGKVVFGDQSLDNETLLSSWNMASWRGGWLVEEMDESSETERCWISTLDTRYHKQLIIPPLRTICTGVPASTPQCGRQFNDLVYVGFANNEIYSTSLGGSVFNVAHTAGGGVYNMITTRQGTTRWLFCGTTSGYTRFDTSTWTNVASSASRPVALAAVNHDGKIWAMDGNGQLWECTSLSGDTWDNSHAVLPVEDVVQPPVRELVVFPNPAGDPVIHAVSRTGIWWYDEDALVWHRTEAQWPYTKDPGVRPGGATVYRSDLYAGVGLDLFQYNGSTIRNIGFNRADGLPESFAGSIQSVHPFYNWLVVGLRPTSNGTEPPVFFWDGVGWHWIGETPNANTVPVGFVTASTETQMFLYALQSYDGANLQQVNRWSFIHGVFNPRKSTSSTYNIGTHTLLTPWFDAGMPNTTKTAVAVSWLAEGLSSASPTRVLIASYQIDSGNDEGLSTAIPGVTSVATNSGVAALGSGAGITFNRIRFKLSLTNDNSAGTPVLKYFTLKFLKRPARLFGYNFQLDCSKPYDNKQPSELVENLFTINDTDTLVDVRFFRDNQEIVGADCVITALRGVLGTGTDMRGIFDMAVAEIGATLSSAGSTYTSIARTS